MTGSKATIKSLTGDEPYRCPWSVYSDPWVTEVLSIHQAWDSPLATAMLGTDPPDVIVEGVMYFHQRLSQIQYHDIEQERKK